MPGGVQGYDRYAYANNDPILFADPSGHSSCVGKFADDGPMCAEREGSELNIQIKNAEYQNKVKKDIEQAANNLVKGYQPSAFIFGFGGGAGIGTFSQVGAENVIMLGDDGRWHAQAFGYYGQGSGEGASVAPYEGVVFNLKDFESYTGPFTTYNLTVGLGEGVTLSYFHDSNATPLRPGAVQGFSISNLGAFGLSGSATYTSYQELNWP